MNQSIASVVVASIVAPCAPALVQAAPSICDGVVVVLMTPDVARGSPIEVEVTVRSDLLGSVSGVVQFTGFQGPGSILTSANQTFSAAKTSVTVNTKPTTIANNYKGTLLGVVNGFQCEKRVEGALDLYAP
ncbi:hypothetical protein [Pseudomonas pharyngis]|uniref:hypothetical protein n=1 Tax=Pseudomonas pharyngis TaxID=2892333 RepID=UPI001F3E4091|nr:hypothetical protein [Pseudomonas pharyngis]